MSLVFQYQQESVGRPILALGGRWVRPRPVVPVTLIGPSNSRVRDALLDPGADDTVFPESLAAVIGIDLSHAPRGTGAGVGASKSNVPLRYAQVTLRLESQGERHEWPAWGGFPPAPLRRPSL